MAHILSQIPLIYLFSSSTSVIPNLRSPVVSPTKLKSPFSYSISFAASPPAHQMNTHGNEFPNFKDFPYVFAPIRDLMQDLISMVEIRMSTQLIPYALPQDIEYFQNQSATSHGSLFVLSGAPSSRIDFILGSWLHCKLPTGAALNITSLTCYMNDSSDAPPLVMEFIQGTPTSLVIILDLPPRRDLVLNPDYLKTFYEDTELEKQRQLLLDTIPEAKSYVSPSLYIRSVFSPTAIVARVDSPDEGRLEEIFREKIIVASKAVLSTWLEVCACGERGEVTLEDDKAYLRKRDGIFKSNTIEIDIGSNLPRLFGQEIADRVLAELRGIMGTNS